MRADKPMARRQGAAGKYVSENHRPSQFRSAEGLPASKSAEHQAKVFAPAFLINDKIAETLSNAQEIALAFGISLESAKIYFDQLTKRRDRKKSAERVRKSADETIAVLKNAARPQPTYLRDPCICGMLTLRWEGTKVRCSQTSSMLHVGTVRFAHPTLGRHCERSETIHSRRGWIASSHCSSQ